MDFYDAHIHFFFKGPVEPFFNEFVQLSDFRGGCLLMFEETNSDIDFVMPMIPTAYRHMLSEETIRPGEESIEFFRNNNTPEFLPYLDTRYFNKTEANNLGKYIEKGYRGVKILYVPEFDEFNGFEGWERSLGRSVADSEQVTADLMAECERYHMPVLFHVDLRRYGKFVASLLQAHPGINVNIPHFGSSRREMAGFLEKYENCYTDFSSLLPYMKDASEAYLNFIKQFQDRVLFGSDGLYGTTSIVKDYMDFISSFLEDELRQKVVKENYLRFHRME